MFLSLVCVLRYYAVLFVCFFSVVKGHYVNFPGTVSVVSMMFICHMPVGCIRASFMSRI